MKGKLMMKLKLKIYKDIEGLNSFLMIKD